MNDHVIAMFRITRKEVLKRLGERLHSMQIALANIEGVQSEGVKFEKARLGLEKAHKSMSEAIEACEYMRDHVDPVGSWVVTAQQLIEIRTQCAPIELTVDQLRLSITPERDTNTALYNAQGRALRT